MSKFPRAQFEAIQRGKVEDRVVVDLPLHIQELKKKEKALSDLYWSLFHRGKCEDEVLAEYAMHERNALRVRINRCIKRSQSAVDSLAVGELVLK